MDIFTIICCKNKQWKLQIGTQKFHKNNHKYYITLCHEKGRLEKHEVLCKQLNKAKIKSLLNHPGQRQVAPASFTCNTGRVDILALIINDQGTYIIKFSVKF